MSDHEAILKVLRETHYDGMATESLDSIAQRLASRPAAAPGEAGAFGWVIGHRSREGAVGGRLFASRESAERAISYLVWHTREGASVVPLYPHPGAAPAGAGEVTGDYEAIYGDVALEGFDDWCSLAGDEATAAKVREYLALRVKSRTAALSPTRVDGGRE